jgi:hypothetical protein
MSEVSIVHESAIFDQRRVRLMNESNTIRFRALKISSSTKKENKRSSRRSLKAEMKDLCNIVFASTSIQIENIDKKRLQLHDQFKKIENSLSI